jgi:hypothetical protein
MRRLRHLVLALLLLFVATPALADQVDTYEGTAGSARIVVGLTDSNGEVSGQYFYRSVRFDIDLSGQWQGSSLALTSAATGDMMNLTRSGTGLVGALTTAKGQKFAVSLRPAAAPAASPADLPDGVSLYERLRLAGLTLTPQQTQTLNGKTIQWYREPLTGIRLFRLQSGYGAPAMAAINHALAQIQWSDVSTWFQCAGLDGRPGFDSAQADKPWLGPVYVSYVWRSSWTCAGTAHPDAATTGHSFDTRTGHEIGLDEVLPFGGASIPPENSDKWLDYRSKVFAPAVIALLKRDHPAQMAPPKDEDGCNYSDADVWSFPNWVLTEKGLWLGADFPHVMQPCGDPDWAVIPWSALSPRYRAAH